VARPSLFPSFQDALNLCQLSREVCFIEMECPLQSPPPEEATFSPWQTALALATFSEETTGSFIQVMTASLSQSLDAAELELSSDGRTALLAHRTNGQPKDELWLLLLEKGKPAGIILGNDMGEGTLEMVYCGVAPAFRGKGLGQCLVAILLRRGRELGYDRLRLCVDEKNRPAIAIYEKTGFRRIGERRVFFRKV